MAKRLNQVRIGAVMSYINMAVGTLIPMFYTPLMLGLLGQDEYGLFKLSSSVTSYLTLISFGLGSAVTRYYTKFRAEDDRDGEESVFGLFSIIYMIIASITVIVGVIIAANIGAIYGNSINGVSSTTGIDRILEMQILVIVLTLTTALNFLSTPHTSIVSAHEKFIFLQLINIVSTVITPIVNIVVMMMGFGSIGIVVSSFGITLVVRVMYLLYVKFSIRIKPNYKNISKTKSLLKEILSFSIWIFIMTIIDQLYNSTDTLIIGYIPELATVGVAVYSIGITFNSMIRSFSTGLNSVLTPKTNMMVFRHASNEELTDLLIRIGRLQCYIVSLITTGFIAFGQQFIHLWVGFDYNEAYWVAIITTIPVCIPLVQNVALNIIIAQNRLKFRTAVFATIAVINVIGTALCVKEYGIIGAALMTGIAFLVGQGFVMNWYYWKKVGLGIPRFWKNVGPIFIIPIILCTITIVVTNYFVLDTWMKLLLGILIYTGIFCVVNWLLVMNKYEKEIFQNPIRRIIEKIRLKRCRNK